MPPLLSAFLSAVGFVGTCIGIFNLYRSHPGPTHQRNQTLIGIITAIFLLTFIFTGLSALGAKGTNASPSPSANNGPSEVNTQKQGSPSPTTTPEPSPSPIPNSGTPTPQFLNLPYSEHWSQGLDGWHGDARWKYLPNTGIVNAGGGSIFPPGVVNVINYAVQVKLQVQHESGSYLDENLFFYVRGDDNEANHAGYQLGGQFENEVLNFCPGLQTGDNFQFAHFTGTCIHLDNSWHIYRVEVQGNRIKFLLDGKVLLDQPDNTFLSGGKIGIGCGGYDIQLNVSSFEVTAL